MTAESEKVAIHGLHIHLEVRRALGTVNQNRDAVLMGNLDNLLDGINGSQHIADMSHTDDLRLFSNHRLQHVQTQNTIIGNGQVLYNDAPFHCLKLP